MHTYFRKAEQMSGQPEEQIDTGLLDVPEVDVQHLPPLQCTSTEQKESLIAGERVRKMNAAKDSHNDQREDVEGDSSQKGHGDRDRFTQGSKISQGQCSNGGRLQASTFRRKRCQDIGASGGPAGRM